MVLFARDPKPTQLGKVEVKGRGKTGGDRPRDPPGKVEVFKKRRANGCHAV